MPTWEETKDAHIERLNTAEKALEDVIRDSTIWYRVSQSASRALEQVQVARDQLKTQSLAR